MLLSEWREMLLPDKIVGLLLQEYYFGGLMTRPEICIGIIEKII
jgi:hypothetical protein